MLGNCDVHSGLDKAAYARVRTQAAELAPRRHRAEADARHLAVLWNIVTSNEFLRSRPTGRGCFEITVTFVTG